MKNIYLLPTEEDSRLYFNNNLNILELCDGHKNNTAVKPTRHLYITSGDEIKEDDYYLSWQDNYNPPQYVIYVKCSSINGDGRKIILTTDPNLIENGIQAIDNDFLEWFVNNPTCEFVECKQGFEDGTSYGYNFLDYKIIIPEKIVEPVEKTINIKEIILKEYANGNIIFAGIEGLQSMPMNDFLEQSIEGMLYDLNRSELVVLTLIEDPKWVNDFAVAKVIRALKSQLEESNTENDKKSIEFAEWLCENYGRLDYDGNHIEKNEWSSGDGTIHSTKELYEEFSNR